MKKFLTTVMALSLTAAAVTAVTPSLASADEAADSILAQMQTFKQKNNGDTAAQTEETSEKKDQDVKEENVQPAEEEKANEPVQPPKAAETPEAPAEADKTETAGSAKSSAASTMDQIVKEEAEKASRAQEASPNNRGVIVIPSSDAEENKAEDKSVEPVKAEEAKAEAEKTSEAPKTEEPKAETTKIEIPKAEEPKTEESKAEDSIATAAPAVVLQKIPSETEEASAPVKTAVPVNEIPAGRPLNPSKMDTKATNDETDATLIVEADWLIKNYKNAVIIDARPDSLYTGGHIPGAVNAPWTYFANVNAAPGTEKWGIIWPPATMGKRIGALGIDGKKPVVVYCDSGGWGQSGWVIWILRQAGIKNARMLDGGIGAWKNAGGQLVKNKQTNKAVAFNLKDYVPGFTVSTEWINNNLGKPGLVLIDVRTEPEYLGKIRPFQEKRAGHLPGAINIPREDFLDENGEIKHKEEVLALLTKHGVTPENEIVVYDTAGVRASFVTMILRCAEYLNSQNYDAGFQAWAGNPDLPIVKP
ncbi:MAG: hypothetical protein HUJ86_00515 [Synergistes sp.]|nr:hypothetical protein [Synergistes sp.]